MSNLIIGDSSQLAKYMPEDFCRCSSRDDEHIKQTITSQKWDKVYLCFGEHRKFLVDSENEFFEVNEAKTIQIINKYSEYANKFIVFSSSGLWNKVVGKYNLDTPFCHDNSFYLQSKQRMTETLQSYDNVIILYPCNFNSKYKPVGFLHDKLNGAITQNRKYDIVGNLNFSIELYHAKYVSEKSIQMNTNQIISPGILTNMKHYFTEVLNHFGKKYSEYFVEGCPGDMTYATNLFDVVDENYSVQKLITQTIEDFK